jgi:predicted RNA-binding protein YlxR (DUF448 family)
VGCREHGGKRALLRVVRTLNGEVVLDADQRAPGRGAYLHEDAECIRLARRRKALERALRTGAARRRSFVCNQGAQRV